MSLVLEVSGLAEEEMRVVDVEDVLESSEYLLVASVEVLAVPALCQSLEVLLT